MQTSFQLILDDTSPVVNYYPFAETLGAADLIAGWNSYFTQSGFLSVLGQTGEGTSLHVTGLEGAELTIQWFGTGIALYGNVYQAAYSISVDGEGQHLGVPKGDLLAEVQGLEATQHIIVLVAHPSPNSTNVPSSYVAFDQAALNVSTEFAGATVSTEFVDATSSLWLFFGNWTHLSDPVLNSEPTQNYFLSTTQGDSVTISFRGTAVSIIGIRNTTMGHYNVTLDGTTTTLDGHSDWLGSSTLFLQAGLDEMSRHSLTITNADGASVAIAGLNITHVQGGALASESSSHGMPSGTTAALILAGLIAFVIVSSALVHFYIRRRRNRSRKHNYAIPPGLSTSSYLKDFTIAMGSSPKHRQFRTSKHELSTFARQAGRDEEDSRIELDSEVLIASNNRPTMVDPASPSPYLRIPSSSGRLQKELNSPAKEENDKDYRRRSQLGPGRRGRRRDKLDEDMEEVPLTPSSGPDSPSNNSVPERIRTYRNGKRSLSVDPEQHHHDDIPSPNSEVDLSHMVTTPTSARQERTSLLFSQTTHGSCHRSRRSSFGASFRFSRISDNPPSLSTMQFERPSRHSGESDGTHAEWSPKESRAGPSVGEWRLQTVGRPSSPAPPINPSNWQPPW